jgi:hypothetical protein
MTGLRQDRNAAPEIAAAALGRDPGPMTAALRNHHLAANPHAYPPIWVLRCEASPIG